jgi:mRNA interferase RelE/StbE
VPSWKVSLTDEAWNDFRKLDGRQKPLVAKQLLKIEKDPQIGKHLGNKMGMDLTGHYKLYADKKRVRIVYSIEGDLVKVVAIGEREDMDVYRLASKRLTQERE